MFKTEVDLATYSKNFVKIKEKVWEIGKRSAENRELVLNKFSVENWDTLSDGKKEKHTVFDCSECVKDDEIRPTLSLFPIHRKDLKGLKRANEGGLFRPSKEEIKKNTATLVTELNSQYRKNFGTTFDCQYRLSKGIETKGSVSIFCSFW